MKRRTSIKTMTMQPADVTVKAQSDSKIFNTAVVAAGAGTAAVGAGVAVNRIVQQTGAEVQGGTMNLQELDIRAVAAPKIETIGVGGAVGGNVASAVRSLSI